MCGEHQSLSGKGLSMALSRAWILILVQFCLPSASPGEADQSQQDVNNLAPNEGVLPNTTLPVINEMETAFSPVTLSTWEINSITGQYNIPPTTALKATVMLEPALGQFSAIITPKASLSPLQTIESPVTGLLVSPENNPIINEDLSTSLVGVQPSMTLALEAIATMPMATPSLPIANAMAASASVSFPTQTAKEQNTQCNTTNTQSSLFTGTSGSTPTTSVMLTLSTTRTVNSGPPTGSMLLPISTPISLSSNLSTALSAVPLPSLSLKVVTMATTKAAAVTASSLPAMDGVNLINSSLLYGYTTTEMMNNSLTDSSIKPTVSTLSSNLPPSITHDPSSVSNNFLTMSDTASATAFTTTDNTETLDFTTKESLATTSQVTDSSVAQSTIQSTISLISQTTSSSLKVNKPASTAVVTTVSFITKGLPTTTARPLTIATTTERATTTSKTVTTLDKVTTAEKSTTTSVKITTSDRVTTSDKATTAEKITTARKATTKKLTTTETTTAKKITTTKKTTNAPTTKADEYGVINGMTITPSSQTATVLLQVSPEPSVEPEAEDPAAPPPPYAEPVPEWGPAMAAWSWAWPFHIYSIGGLFALLALYSLASMLRLHSRHLLGRGYFLSLNLMMLLMGLLRATYMLTDAYNHRGLLPQVASYLLLSSGFPCLTSAFSILFLALLQSTRMQLASPRIQQGRVIATIIALHFAFSITTDVLVGHFHKSMVLLFTCQAIFALWGLLLFLGYLYVFRRLYLATVYRLKEMKRMSLQKAISVLPGIKPLRKKHKSRLGTAVKITLATALCGLACCGLQVYAMVHVYGLDGHTDSPEPWPWWIFQYTFRLCELGMCYTMSYVATQPFRYTRTGARRKQRGSGGCLHRLCPCCCPEHQHRLRADYPSYDYSQAFESGGNQPHLHRCHHPAEAYPLRVHNNINDLAHHRDKEDGEDLGGDMASITPGPSSYRTPPPSDYNLADLFPSSRSHSGKSAGDKSVMELPGWEDERSRGLAAGEGAGLAEAPGKGGGCTETAFLMPPANSQLGNSSSMAELSRKVNNKASAACAMGDPFARLGSSDWSLGLALGFGVPPDPKRTPDPMQRSQSVDQQTKSPEVKHKKAKAIQRSVSESRPDQRAYRALPLVDDEDEVKWQIPLSSLGTKESNVSLDSLKSETSQTESAVVANYDKISLRSDTIEL